MALGLHHYECLDKLPKPGSSRDPYRRYRCKIPVGERGDWRVRKIVVERDVCLLRSMCDGRGTVPGEYTQLLHGNSVIMTDTDAEIDELRRLFRVATGHVLIHGLGLGIAVCGVLQNDEVSYVEVVEIDKDVIELVGPHIKDKRLKIVHEDCLTRKPVGTWDVVWHDIWPNICGDNLDEIKILRRKFARRCDWQGCWEEQNVRMMS